MRAPRLGDAAIAVGMFLISVAGTLSLRAEIANLGREMDVWGWLLAGLAILPLAWRQRYPRIVLWLVACSWITYVGMNYIDGTVIFGLMVALYSAAVYLPRRQAIIHGGALLGLVVAWTGVGVALYDEVSLFTILQLIIALAIPFAIGMADSRRHARLTELEVAHSRREQAQREAAADAVRAERARIARELHDVVAHEMTVMTLQAEGAKRMASDANPRVAEALGTISESGRNGLAEMQRMIGVLRATEEEATHSPPSQESAPTRDLTPMPSLAALPTLVQQVEDAGLPVELEISGSAHVPAGVELSAYRIVQEALTNAMKHAGPGATATVVVRRRSDAVTVTVEDDGRGVISEAALTSGGHGLRGMRERVAALGGELEHGPRRGGGYRVHAVLPSSDDQVARAQRAAAQEAS